MNKGIGDVERTNRGFQIIHFKDCYGEECTLQASSLADYEPPGTSAIWLGQGENRMHLKLEQVKQLINNLQNWIEEGKFE